MPDSLPNKPASAFQPPTASDLGGEPSKASSQPTPAPKAAPLTPPVKPLTPSPSASEPPKPPEPLKPAGPSSTPPEKPTPPPEKPTVSLQKPGGKPDSKKAKIVGAVLGLLLLVVALPVAVYLVSQRQYIWPKAAYPGCEAQLKTEAEDRELCDNGSEAKVYVWAERSQGAGCEEATASYTYKKSSCCGDRYEDCEVACSEHQETHSGTVTISAGQTSSSRKTVSCQIPTDCGDDCAACQVDVVGGWGQMAWECPEAPGYKATCEDCMIYDEEWQEITAPLEDQSIYLATYGSSTHPDGRGRITKARFRVTVDGVLGSWQETTDQFDPGDGSVFYIEYTIPSTGSYTVESMVYGPDEGGWK